MTTTTSTSTICLNGGTCVTATRTDPTTGRTTMTESHCDCTTATDRDGNFYAGKLCEHVSTSVCNNNNNGNGNANDSSSSSSSGSDLFATNLFCTQGGRCRYVEL